MKNVLVKLASLSLLFFLAVAFSSCGGGGGGNSTAEDEPGNLLPDTRYFIPEYMEEACLEIQGADAACGSYSLQLHCRREFSSGPCVGGDVPSAPESWVKVDYAEPGRKDVSRSFSGRWEHRDSNTPNCIAGLLIYQNDNGERELVTNLSLHITARLDDPTQTDETIILSGCVASGTLHPASGEKVSLQGASLTLTYTIAAGQVNETTHHTPAEP